MSLDIYLYTDNEYVWSSNITHNLNEIADKAGVTRLFGDQKKLVLSMQETTSSIYDKR